MTSSRKWRQVITREQTFDVLEAPLNHAEVKERVDEENWLTVIVGIDLDTLLDMGGIEGLNDWADDNVVEHGVLSDIGYKAVGFDSKRREILIEISADAAEVLDHYD